MTNTFGRRAALPKTSSNELGGANPYMWSQYNGRTRLTTAWQMLDAYRQLTTNRWPHNVVIGILDDGYWFNADHTRGTPVGAKPEFKDLVLTWNLGGVVADDEREWLAAERAGIAGSLTAIEHVVRHSATSRVDRAERREDPVARAEGDTREAIDAAQNAVAALPPIAREALFQYFHNGQPLTVGGALDRFGSARRVSPRVAAAIESLERLRALTFEGTSMDAGGQAPP